MAAPAVTTMPLERPSRRFLLMLLVVVALGLAVRVAFIEIVAPPVGRFSDAQAYHLLANNLADGEGYVRPYDFDLFGVHRPTAEYPPLFPGVLAVGSLVGLRSFDAHRLILCGFGAVTVGLVGLLGRRAGGSAVGIVAAAVAALYPMLFQADAALMPETLAALFGALLVLLALRVLERPASWWRWAVFGLISGTAVLTRSEFIVLVPLLLVPLGWRYAGREGPRRAVLAAGTTVAMAALVVLPWTVRNWSAFGALVPVSNNIGSVARGANCELAYHGEYRGIWVVNLGNDASGSVDPARQCFRGFQIDAQTDEAAAAADDRAAGLRYARDHVSELPGVVAVRWLRTFGLYRPTQQAGFEALEGRDLGWERRGTWMFYGVAVLAAAGLIRGRARCPRWALVMPVVATSLTVMATYGNQRFRAAAEPTLVVLAALALVAAGEEVRRRRVGGPQPHPEPDGRSSTIRRHVPGDRGGP